MATFVFDPACGGHRGEHRLVENRRSSARTTPARSICFVPIYQELYHCRLSGVCATYYLGAKRSTLGRKRNALVDYVRRRSDVANAPEWLAFSRWDKGVRLAFGWLLRGANRFQSFGKRGTTRFQSIVQERSGGRQAKTVLKARDSKSDARSS